MIVGKDERFVGVGLTFLDATHPACNHASPAKDIARSVVWPVSLARAMLSSYPVKPDAQRSVVASSRAV